jgi:hypothetical protein
MAVTEMLISAGISGLATEQAVNLPSENGSIAAQIGIRPSKGLAIVNGRQTAGRLSLSNPTGLINLGRIAEPESVRRRSHLTKICALAASQRPTHILGYRSG